MPQTPGTRNCPISHQNSYCLKGCVTQIDVFIGQKTQPGKGPHEGAFLKGCIKIFRADPWHPKIYHMHKVRQKNIYSTALQSFFIREIYSTRNKKLQGLDSGAQPGTAEESVRILKKKSHSERETQKQKQPCPSGSGFPAIMGLRGNLCLLSVGSA